MAGVHHRCASFYMMLNPGIQVRYTLTYISSSSHRRGCTHVLQLKFSSEGVLLSLNQHRTVSSALAHQPLLRTYCVPSHVLSRDKTEPASGEQGWEKTGYTLNKYSDCWKFWEDMES